jgi:acyl-CoA hydrolase
VNYYNEYKNKLVSADEAVKVVKSGDGVAYGHFAMAPKSLDKALAKRKDELNNVTVRSTYMFSEAEVAKVNPKYKHFIYNSAFLGSTDRNLDGNRCAYLPSMYTDEPKLIREGHAFRSNVVFLMTPPMDKYGYFNFSVSCSYQRALCDRADVIVVAINRNAPVCLGGEQENVHISEVAHVVELGDEPMPVFGEGLSGTDVERSIAYYIVEEMEDRCTLQLGIGGLVAYIGKMIVDSGLKDLGIHTEMMSDAFMDMYEKGVVTGKFKNIDRNKIAYTFAMGSKKLYEFLDNNPACAIYPVDISNNPQRISMNNKQVAVNNALMVDLYGQVCSEAINFRQISGTGGQVDFTYGAWLSKGGKSFICLPSTRKLKNGEVISRIVPHMPAGTIVTDPRTIPMFIITEYGKVNIKGKSVWDRTEQLISIAHPDFRDELIKAAEKQNIWVKSNKINKSSEG